MMRSIYYLFPIQQQQHFGAAVAVFFMVVRVTKITRVSMVSKVSKVSKVSMLSKTTMVTT